jgi:aminopeptidase N
MLFSENPDTIASAIELFHSATLEKLDPELREVAISATVSHEGKDADIELLLKTYSETGSAELRQDICSGLTSTRSIKVIDKLLNLVKDTSIIRTQDTSRWLIYLIRNKYSRLLTWQWIRDNWDWINQTFSGDKSYDEYPRYAATALITDEQLDEYRDFFTPMQSDPALSRVIEMGINEIKNRIDTIARDGKSVRNALLEIK